MVSNSLRIVRANDQPVEFGDGKVLAGHALANVNPQNLPPGSGMLELQESCTPSLSLSHTLGFGFGFATAENLLAFTSAAESVKLLSYT